MPTSEKVTLAIGYGVLIFALALASVWAPDPWTSVGCLLAMLATFGGGAAALLRGMNGGTR